MTRGYRSDRFPQVAPRYVRHMWGGSSSYESKRDAKATARGVLAAQTAPSRLRWSEVPLSFDKDDLPENYPRPGCYPPLVSPVIGTVWVHHVFVDGGSSFSIIMTKMLDQMRVLPADIRPISRLFYGIVPRVTHGPVRQIILPVIFSDEKYYCRELCTFEVVDFEMAYNALLGQPRLGQFMAIPSYTHVMLKMLGPLGVIAVRGSLCQAVKCEQRSFDLAMQPRSRASETAGAMEEPAEETCPVQAATKERFVPNL